MRTYGKCYGYRGCVKGGHQADEAETCKGGVEAPAGVEY
jgi:hypothetical protein